jgi:hypothetical protein
MGHVSKSGSPARKSDAVGPLFQKAADIAKNIGIPANEIEAMAKRGELSHLPIGGQLLFNHEQVANELVVKAEDEAQLGTMYGLNGDSLDKLRMIASLLRARQELEAGLEVAAKDQLRSRGVTIEFI